MSRQNRIEKSPVLLRTSMDYGTNSAKTRDFGLTFFFPMGTGWHHSEQKWIQICFGLIIVLLCTKVNWYKRGGERRRTTF